MSLGLWSAASSVLALPGVALVLARYGPDALLRLLAGCVAVLTHDDGRGRRSLEVLRLLRRDAPELERRDRPPIGGAPDADVDGGHFGQASR